MEKKVIREELERKNPENGTRRRGQKRGWKNEDYMIKVKQTRKEAAKKKHRCGSSERTRKRNKKQETVNQYQEE